MKVRYNDQAYEVLEESPSFYVVKCPNGPIALYKDLCLPVPEERWEDVTAECGAFYSTIRHKGVDVSTAPQAYRLRKVEGYGKLGDAVFIVERKVV